jgi:hypothetical protein
MLSAISERGPKIDEVARLIGTYNETARYWYKSLLSRGLSIQASCNYERLGMRRIIVVVELGEVFKDCADTVFSELGQVAYAISYAKVKDTKRYISSFSVPDDCAAHWIDFMLELRRKGFFRSMENISLDWVRNVPVQAKYFDFGTGRWRKDWRSKNANVVPTEVCRDQRQQYDLTDLKIIEQLQINADVSLTDVFAKTGAKNYNTFAWHYRAHILGRGLIRGYRLNYTTLRFGSESGTSDTKRRSYSWVDLVADNLSESEKSRLRVALAKVPFVWIEGSGPRTHYARIACPTSQLTNLLNFLRDAGASGGGIRSFRLDPGHGLSFSLSNHFFDKDVRRWVFKKEEALQRLEALLRIKSGVAQRRS